MRRVHFFSGAVGALVLVVIGCRSTVQTPIQAHAPAVWWDAEKAEILVWQSDDPAFDQQRALEGSGLVAHDGVLYAVSEKYAQLLRIDPESLQVETIALDIAPFSEIEGVAVGGGEILVCDEANAAVWATRIPGSKAENRLTMRRLELDGVEIQGGKLGVEGITIAENSPTEIFLMLERIGSKESGCDATIFRLGRVGDLLSSKDEPLVIPLEDCNWRLTGLQFWNGRLLALKTRYPGEQYQVVVVDRNSGNLTTVLEMTEQLMAVREQGWGNNIEGLTVTDDGALWLISDNAMTDRAETATPPPGKEKTLLMRIPPLDLPEVDVVVP